MVWQRDVVANDSDKTFTCPVDKLWSLFLVEGCIATTATVGNRIMTVIISDATGAIWSTPNSGNIAASSNGQVITGAQIPVGTTATRRTDGVAGLAAVQINHPLPSPFYMTAGQTIRVYDAAAIDAAADDMSVVLHYIEYDV